MSTEQTAAPVAAPDPTLDPIGAVLHAHADKLHPGAVDQLRKLVEADYQGAAPALARESLERRLASPEFAHFLRPEYDPSNPVAAARRAAEASARRQEESIRRVVAGRPVAPMAAH